jgi:hypothetical protein
MSACSQNSFIGELEFQDRQLNGPLIPCDDRPPIPNCALINGESSDYGGVEAKFYALANEWREYNLGRSTTEYCHAAYMQIIGMGKEIVPFLIEQVKAGDGDWLVALKYITGAKVTTPDMRGDFARIREAWLGWAQDYGIGNELFESALSDADDLAQQTS